MDFEVTNYPNPWERASFLSRVVFSWLIPLFQKGWKNGIEQKDIFDCPTVDRSEQVGDMLQKEWDKEIFKLKKGSKPSFLKAVARAFGPLYALNGIFILVEECFIHVLQPIMLGYVVQYFAQSSDEIERTDVIVYGICVCILASMFVFTHHPYFFGAQRFGMRIRIACCAMVYKKALKLSQAALGKTTVGQMVNLLSNDVNRFDTSVIYLPFLIAGPIQTIIIILILWTHIGPACLAGISVLLLYIPFQGLMGRLFSRLRSKTAALTDERIRLMNEIIAGMRVIKMYTWEYPFAKLVDLARKKEVAKIRRTNILRGVNIALFFVSSKIILFISFIVFATVLRREMTPQAVFVSMALFNNLRIAMTLFFPYAVSQGAESIISLKRIEKFLLLEEQEDTNLLNTSNLRPKLEQCGIWMNSVTAKWNKNIEEWTLNKISFTVKPGELLAVVGSVGSGKTSLLMSLLGELPILSGEAKIRGKMSYSSQEPWVFGGSVKQNVLFGNIFNSEKYKKVLHVCALDKDIEQLPYGDQTLVGERGVSLSGGQKARVNLARALYYDADIFLMDDPLSAVDAAVSRHLFEKCINGYLKDKVRILCTHQIQFLKGATQILVIKEGKCLALGSYEQLVNAGVDFGSLLEEFEEEEKKLRCKRASVGTIHSQLSRVSDEYAQVGESAPMSLYESSLSVSSALSDDSGSQYLAEVNTNTKIPKENEEIKTVGAVTLKIYKEYIFTGAAPIVRGILLLSYICTQILFNGSDYWLTKWTNEEQLHHNIKNCMKNVNISTFNYSTIGDEDCVDYLYDAYNISKHCGKITDCFNRTEFVVPLKYNVSIYSTLVWGVFLFSLVRTTCFFFMCMKSSIKLHNKMFRCLIRAPIAFFDNNPVGSILNRCSRDVGMIDDVLPPTASDFTEIFCNMLGILFVVATVQPWLLLPTVILTIVFVFLRKFYLPTARDMKRMEGINRSPVFSHLSTSLYGLSTIRAFRAQKKFEAAFDHHQDRHTAAWFLFISTTRWFGICLDWLCVLYISSVTMALVLSSEDDEEPGKVGLAIASALQLSGTFQWGVRQSAEVESQMTSVERVIEYSNLPSEADLDSKPDKKPPPTWPQKGEITFNDVSLIYSPHDPPVLKNLTCQIHAKEKIGIVGRTGAGKSSMIATLFRMTEPYGTLLLDGFATKDLGLHDLRRKISIIPQDPVLFTGPVRRNLDPFNEHTDESLWQALDEAYLKESVEELPGGLDTELSEGGSNFSVGQRQLICLARAILRRNRVLVLDEATANVDPKTDSLIQATIRQQFKDCTVLTIAHRLHTIMDSDRVLVLDGGRIEEFDEPYTLLLDENSFFFSMVKMTGPAMAKQLKDVATQAHIVRKASNINPNKVSTPRNSVFGGHEAGDVIIMNGKVKQDSLTEPEEIRLSVPEENRSVTDDAENSDITDSTQL